MVKVLCHGYVDFIESWGSDERIIEAARMSTGKGFLGWGQPHAENCLSLAAAAVNKLPCDCGAAQKAGDERLLAYLYNNKHSTPFEMAGMVIEVKAPIMVFREWHRHRTQSFNEMSARYIPLPDENYLPTVERCIPKPVDQGNRQAQAFGVNIPTPAQVESWLLSLEETYQRIQRVYEKGLDLGIPKELARLPVPVARYSRMRASANLRNWLGFLTLRLAPNAQWEIREYANAVGELVKQQFPRTWELFITGEKRG